MYPTTWASVLVIAPELANAGSLQSTDAQNVLLGDAALLMGYYGPWGVKLEIACRFLAAHLATGRLGDSRRHDPALSYDRAALHLQQATARAAELTSALQNVQKAISGLYVQEDPGDADG